MSTATQWFKGSTPEEIIHLGTLEPLGPRTWQTIYTSYPTLKDFLKEKFNPRIKLAPAQIAALKIKSDCSKRVELLKTKNIRLLTIDDDDYPEILREINDPPLWLYTRGDFKALKQKRLTVVGTRRPTNSAIKTVEMLLDGVVAREICLISGLALGIDVLVHKISLKNGGKTVAVLANGLDTAYPHSHREYAAGILKSGGLIISEYPPLEEPRPYRFPVRNRILAGLSPATLVIEAGLPSGSLTTARSAVDYNRDVWAVPADITKSSIQGTNALLSQGAQIIFNKKQITDFYGLDDKKQTILLDKDEQKILDLLRNGSKTIDELVETLAMPVEKLLTIITQLELESLVFQVTPGCYQRSK